MSDLFRALAPLGLTIAHPMLEELTAAYASPGRAYHVLTHIEEVARHFDAVAKDTGWDSPCNVYLAVLFHDAVYVPGARDNEAKSATLARDAITRFFPDAGIDGARVAELVLATQRHGHLAPGDLGRDDALFVDCDMAILGSSRAAFDAYEASIAAEYSWLPRAAYESGRRAFLTMLAGRRVFVSERFHALYEDAAQANLSRTLAS